MGDRAVVVPEDHYREHGFASLDDFATISFDDYIATERTWDNLTEQVHV
jgi:hypothetical protein